MAPLEKVIAVLGEHADTPNFEQLSEAIDAVSRDGVSIDDVVAVLAFAIAEEFPRRRTVADCLTNELTNLPNCPTSWSLQPSLLPRRPIRDQRAATAPREDEKNANEDRPRSVPFVLKAKPAPKARATSNEPRGAVEESGERRRPMIFTPAELERFVPEHAMVAPSSLSRCRSTPPILGSRTEIQGTPPRLSWPRVPDSLLFVRSIPRTPDENVFQAWRRLGLDHVCYVD